MTDKINLTRPEKVNLANNPTLTEKLVKKIAKLHKNYELEFLKDRIGLKHVYLTNPKDALFFILSFSFYQGRRDELSQQFEEKTKNTLEQFFKNNNTFLSNSRLRITDKNDLKKEYTQLHKKLKENEVNKENDRLMVISLINLIQSKSEKNILKFIIAKIKSNKISEAYKILDSVWSIGPKIASLILRDIIYIYELEEYLNKPKNEPNDYCFLQPIDTWVHKVSHEIGVIGNKKIYKDEAKDITDKCFEFDVNPIHYNQGAWYIGANSWQVLLRNIEVIK